MDRRRENLLPGVIDHVSPPEAIADAHRAITGARRRATWRDVIDLMLLFAVDYGFAHWPHAHVPMMDRHASLTLLVALNGALLFYFWASRKFPSWRAKRIASTWSQSERQRVFGPVV
jgi:hypothetical protein